MYASAGSQHSALILALAVFVAVPAGLSAQADEPALTIELNKVEDIEDGCRTFFIFDNESGHDLHTLAVDIVLFDDDGVVLRQIGLSMAPLRNGKRSVARFDLDGDPCATIGSILINDIYECTDDSGNELDCIDLLEARSRTSIPLDL